MRKVIVSVTDTDGVLLDRTTIELTAEHVGIALVPVVRGYEPHETLDILEIGKECKAMRRKYRYATRADAETVVQAVEQELTLHRIALDALLRDEFVWTDDFHAKTGAWFQMGIARCNAMHGGVVMVKYYPTNKQPSQHARWADGWIRDMNEYWRTFTSNDEESETYRACFGALREIYNRERTVSD